MFIIWGIIIWIRRKYMEESNEVSEEAVSESEVEESEKE